ncbi:Radical SAM domain protein [uncultured Pleomorphomonas sp.]|uniref:Radical SAM domain protein n=1 Tax=uncultured Pleomorphomonas sp. TaxID=442121 RepID=A0A212LFP2_9HYPH|nr:Radical SAM domain protein [uncultured Pleomorphomonas sp.]
MDLDVPRLPTLRLADLVPPAEPAMSAESMRRPASVPVDALDAFLPIPAADPLTGAFPRRVSPMPWRHSQPVAAEEQAAALDRLRRTPRRTSSVAYLHVPFCRSRCLFCGFWRNPWHEDVSKPFTDLLIREIELRSRQPLVQDGPALTAVYLGGGTPTALDAADIARIVLTLRRCLPLAETCEITLEGRTSDITVEKITAAIEAGVNRVSLGVQSFDTEVRRKLGRRQPRAELIDRINMVTRKGAAIVIDLIYGLPGQTADVWARDIATAADEIGLDGLDIYALNVFPGGPLARSIASGKLAALPGIEDQARAYAAARAWFADRGWSKLSQAHLGRTPLERNIYNRQIKAGATCLAFGPGSGGSDPTFSWRIDADLERWQSAIEAGEEPIVGLVRHPPFRAASAAITAGFENGRLDLGAIDRLMPGFAERSSYLFVAWERAGLIRYSGDVVETTLPGDFWATTLSAGATSILQEL